MDTKTYEIALKKVWDVIGFDILDISPDQIIDRDDLIGAVIDYVEPYGELSKEEYKIWKELPYETKEEIGKKAFPYKQYGM